VLSDRERRALDEIERQLLSSDPRGSQFFGAGPADAPLAGVVDSTAEAYAVFAVFSSVFAMLFVTRWPVLTAIILASATVSWKVANGAGRPSRRLDGEPPPR
jgi:hypothetical protein